MNIYKLLRSGTGYVYIYMQRLYRNLPYHLPVFVRQFIATYLWIVAAAAGVIQLLFAFAFLEAGYKAAEAVQATTYLSRIYGAPAAAGALDFFFYATVVVMVLVGALILAAVPALRRYRQRRGWNVIFWALLFHIVYGICRTFSEIDGGVLHGIVALVFSFTGIGVLFEILPYFRDSPTKIAI